MDLPKVFAHNAGKQNGSVASAHIYGAIKSTTTQSKTSERFFISFEYINIQIVPINYQCYYNVVRFKRKCEMATLT